MDRIGTDPSSLIAVVTAIAWLIVLAMFLGGIIRARWVTPYVITVVVALYMATGVVSYRLSTTAPFMQPISAFWLAAAFMMVIFVGTVWFLVDGMSTMAAYGRTLFSAYALTPLGLGINLVVSAYLAVDMAHDGLTTGNSNTIWMSTTANDLLYLGWGFVVGYVVYGADIACTLYASRYVKRVWGLRHKVVLPHLHWRRPAGRHAAGTR